MGGEYITVLGVIKRIDEVNHTIILTDKSLITKNLICNLEGENFE